MLGRLLLLLKNINELHYRWVRTRENSECMISLSLCLHMPESKTKNKTVSVLKSKTENT